MLSSYSRSIFAYELERIVAPRKLVDLSRVPVSLDPRKVNALVDSLKSVRRLPALNPGEIMTIVIQLKLEDDHRLHIYAALIALGVQRLLLEYLSDERAWEVSQEVRESALIWLRKQRGRDPFRRIRGLGTIQEPVLAETTNPLEVALDAYDEGTVLITLSPLSVDRDEHELLAQAQLYFEQARSTLELLPPTVRASEEWQYWYDQVKHELEEIQDELG